MDLAESLAVYVDDRVYEEQCVCEEDLFPSKGPSRESEQLSSLDSAPELKHNIGLLAKAFKKGRLTTIFYRVVFRLANTRLLLCSTSV